MPRSARIASPPTFCTFPQKPGASLRPSAAQVATSQGCCMVQSSAGLYQGGPELDQGRCKHLIAFKLALRLSSGRSSVKSQVEERSAAMLADNATMITSHARSADGGVVCFRGAEGLTALVVVHLRTEADVLP